jgi:hypothetical protein
VAPQILNHLGAVFQVTANNGETGTLTLLDSGNGLAVWVSVQSSIPFSSLTFFEPSGDSGDQYFGSVVFGPAPVPLPPSIAVQLTGLCLLGLLVWRRRLDIRVSGQFLVFRPRSTEPPECGAVHFGGTSTSGQGSDSERLAVKCGRDGHC